MSVPMEFCWECVMVILLQQEQRGRMTDGVFNTSSNVVGFFSPNCVSLGCVCFFYVLCVCVKRG